MKTNKLPQSVWTDSQAAGSQSQQLDPLDSQFSTGYKKVNKGSSALYLSGKCDYNRQSKQNQQDFQSSIFDSDENTEGIESHNDKEDVSKLVTKEVANKQHNDIPERIFMNGLIKHTGIALAIIIPLAAFSAYAASPSMPISTAINTTSAETRSATLAVAPSDIIYKSARVPTTVDSVDLE